VRSTTAAGFETVSGDMTFTTSSSCSAITDPPGAPTDISSIAGNAQVTISWTAGTGTSSSLIRYGTTSGNLSTIIDPATSQQTITSLVNGTPIYYQVGDKNTAGTTWNSTEYIVTPVMPIVIPTLTSPTATAIGSTTATLGANVTSTGSGTITRGTVWGTSANPIGNAATEVGTTTGIFSHGRTLLTAGTKIFYRGYATNSAGTGYSPDGSFYTEPSTQASGVNFTTVTSTGMTVNWTRGNGDGVIVVMKQGSAVNSDPVDGTYTGYVANPAFTSGTQIGSGNYVVYKGTGTSVAITGLTAGTTYYVAVYEYKGTGDTAGVDQGTNYKSTAASGSQASAGGGGGTATLIGINYSQNTHPYTHFWVNDATDTNLIADSDWSSDVHTSSATFVVPAGVGYIMHVEWAYEPNDDEFGDPGTDSRVVTALEASPGATVTWQLNLP
jgi:hypothetical protein